MHKGSCRMGDKVRTALAVRCSEKPIPISLSDPLMYPLMFKQVHRRNSNSPIKSFTTYSTLGAPCKCVCSPNPWQIFNKPSNSIHFTVFNWYYLRTLANSKDSYDNYWINNLFNVSVKKESRKVQKTSILALNLATAGSLRTPLWPPWYVSKRFWSKRTAGFDALEWEHVALSQNLFLCGKQKWKITRAMNKIQGSKLC